MGCVFELRPWQLSIPGHSAQSAHGVNPTPAILVNSLTDSQKSLPNGGGNKHYATFESNEHFERTKFSQKVLEPSLYRIQKRCEKFYLHV